MPDKKRIALYIGNEMYPCCDPYSTIIKLQQSPLTSAILGLVNQSGANLEQLVYNDVSNPLYDASGEYLGNGSWPDILKSLKGRNLEEAYLSFSTNGTTWMSNLIANNKSAAITILRHIKEVLGFDGIDLDYEDYDLSSSSPIYSVADAAIGAGLKLTAAPYFGKDDWKAWVQFVTKNSGTVSWLNLQCYAGGISNSPGDWLDIGVPIVPGSCNSCCCPQTTCTPTDMRNLFTLWTTGLGSVTENCWDGEKNTAPLAIGGGVIWVYSSIKGPAFLEYMNAVKAGLESTILTGTE